MPEQPEPHVIKLHAGWQCKSVSIDGSTQTIWRRNFGRPTNLDTIQDILLVFDHPLTNGRVLLNGSELGQLDTNANRIRFEIKDQLQVRNEIRIETQQHSEVGQVSLEIISR